MSATALARVLVVDDDPLNLRTAYEALRGRYELLVARSGADALKVCESHHPDLVLLDIEMPGLSGVATCELLKRRAATRDIPVIFVTGHATAQMESDALSVGAVDFVRKPINPAVLLARVTTHVRLKVQADQLRELAFVDALTRLGNRRHHDYHFGLEWRACQRESQPLGVLMIDVDHFKAYNDHYGHPTGDRALLEIAQALRAHLRRPRDILSRYGGEEFVCVQPGVGAEELARTAEHLRAAVESLEIAHAASPTSAGVTISVGGACVVPEKGLPSTSLIQAADQQLYLAKANGRNCGSVEGHERARAGSTTSMSAASALNNRIGVGVSEA